MKYVRIIDPKIMKTLKTDEYVAYNQYPRDLTDKQANLLSAHKEIVVGNYIPPD